MTSNTLWASVNFFGQITIQKRYFVFESTAELRTLYIQELCTAYPRTFPVQRKEIDFVEVRLL